ncbi:MAG TPA: zinc ribbon domain-containing protein [Anaerolineae bacterium]|nr:zinc ribbon domain-containing protein [Anaerolineae bacterium]
MTDEKVRCPSCERENDPAAQFCEQCGADLTAPVPEFETEATELICEHCSEVNTSDARFCKACGEPLVGHDSEGEIVAKKKKASKTRKTPKEEPQAKTRKRLPGWARILITALIVAVVGAGLGLGFAYVSPFLDTYMTHSPSRMERAGLLAQEFVDRVYPAFAEAEHTVLVDTDTIPAVYVVDFVTYDGEKSLALRVLVDKYITVARALEYLEIDAPEPYDTSVTIDAGEGVQVQPLPSEGLGEILINPQIVGYDDFSSLDEARWRVGGEVEINAAGEAELKETEPNAPASRLVGQNLFAEGEGFIFSLRFTAGSVFNFWLNRGSWQESGYLRAGMESAEGSLETSNYVEGPERIDEQVLQGLTLVPDRWYGVLGAVEGGNHLLFVIWDLEDPSQSAAFEKDFGPEAAGSSWELQIAALGSSVMVDDYYELRCEGFQ